MQIEQRVPDKNARVAAVLRGRHALGARGGHARRARLLARRDREPRLRALEGPRLSDGDAAQLTEAQRDRYSRHILLPEVGEVGTGEAPEEQGAAPRRGRPRLAAALYLAAAGVGTLGIVDADIVDASNLQRQILHATSRVGMPKVESAAKALSDLNPDVKVVPHQERMTSANVERLFEPYDLVVDGTDNFPTRYLVNDASVFLGKPVVHGSIFRFDGQ